jgi:acetyl-CoA carboxylase, biotin carboxylase subunit
VNAGTIEFLVDKNLNYYFLEMNTRLQVEHPVTEMVTGIDMVKLQIRIAEGEPLPYSQQQILPRGHAIEIRLCAEDVRNNFLPSTGRISYYKPSQGFGVREDSGIEEGSEISIHYDPMFGKLIAWGMDRNDAIEKMKRALDEYRIVGVETTIPFCRFVMTHPNFIAGNFDIGFVADFFRPEMLEKPDDEERMSAALAAVLWRKKQEAANGLLPASRERTSRWTAQGRR